MQKGNVVSEIRSSNKNPTFRVDIACDPNRSVIVSACAGSGKTWLLVTRMARLLLAGAKPQEILALTFTRKAAQEMRDRLYRLLEEFSQSSDEQLIDHLTERGLGADEAQSLLPTAKSLYAAVLASPQGIVIDTFHGWFGRLLGAAPISTGIQPGFSLREDAKRLQAECLDDWWGNLPVGVLTHYDTLLKALGASETQKFLMGNYGLFKQRGAWTFFSEACKDRGITPIEKLKIDLPRLNIANPLNIIWNAINVKVDLDFLYRCFSNSSATEMAYAPIIRAAIDLKASGGDVMDIALALLSVFITQDNANRTSNDKVAGDLKKYLKNIGESDREQEHVSYKQAWATAFLELIDWQKEHEAYALNEAWFAMSAAMMDHVTAAKESMRVRDFDDLEIGVSQLMSDSANAAYLQSRLDAKYKHILVDEFQDTNPLQWQILRAWLKGYGQDESKPTVFIVGDPKQSIYRFRRADPRLFNDAEAFLVKEMQAASLNQNTTRRNAPQINAAVNQIFSSEQLPESYPFTAQNTLWKAPADGNTAYSNEGEAYLLPLIKHETEELGQRVGNAFEQAIVDAGQTADITQRYVEGQQISSLIQHIIQTRPVADRENGKEVWRKAREGDFLLLVKRRKYIPQFERALREAGLAFESSRLGGLLNTLEIDDLIALLTILVTPRHDLPLAQVLRSPIFAFTESQMQTLAKAMASDQYRSWWDALHDSPDARLMQVARYLEHWRMLGERLPVHDLLDCIYQESDLRIKYASASQEIARAQVLANLDAFLELALNQDGGRYPSLGRFIEETNTIRRGDDDETPDEGDVEAEANLVELDEENELSEEEKNKRVRLMTIHGAKGLEAPFVIMLDANHTEGKAEHRGVLLDWPPENESPSHLSMYTSDTLTNLRSEVRERELLIGKNENWNLLYVAMTRAKQGLWISGVAKAPSKSNPVGLDEKSWYGKATLGQIAILEDQLDQAETKSKGLGSEVAGNPMNFTIDDFEVSWDAAKASHQQQLKDIESGVSLEVFQCNGSAAPVINPAILEEGVHFHHLLEHLTIQTGAISPGPMSADQVARWLGISQELASKALDQANTVLNTKDLQKYLTENQWVQAWNEIDVVTQDGRSFRLDRLVEFDDHLVILDYKLTIPERGSEAHNKYWAQLSNYKQELARIRPDKLAKAYLISSKGEITEVV